MMGGQWTLFVFLKLSVKFDIKQSVNFTREGRDVFVMPTGFVKSFSFQLFSTAIEQRRFRKENIRTV